VNSGFTPNIFHFSFFIFHFSLFTKKNMSNGTLPPDFSSITNGTTSSAATGAGAGAGADPVSAIANAVGKVADFLNTVTKTVGANINLNKKAWLKRLDESIPVFHNWDAERIDKSKDYIYVIGFLVFLIAVIVIAIVLKNKKNTE
jgi:hypothetical protein